MKAKIAFITASILAMAVPEIASAASQLPADALDGVGTDAIDTVKDIAVQFIAVLVGMRVGWFILSATGKGLSKAGVK
ncbi:hypothetical protein LG201_13040 [Methylobacillus gramineus]|uniref:hypothetical protein n=1 Tax=Methylobacillus gramineus TaxID=755169 RepID=UPI001CFFFDBA|nr:hypothetical protein [Methylobacillus gramineus]MCB5186133.1 hypothetical protein [Methylobacillus gramineus]